MAALTQQMVPRIEDGRLSHEDPSQQSSYNAMQHSQDISAFIPADPAQSSRTEERGCSPITVLEARHNAEQVVEKSHSRGSSHTITTTTSWGCPLSATTNIQIEDENSPQCLQFTLHSESRVTLHAPEDVIQELQHLKQHQDQKQSQQSDQTSEEGKHHDGAAEPAVLDQPCEESSKESSGKFQDKDISISSSKEAEEIKTLKSKLSSDHDANVYRQMEYNDPSPEVMPSAVPRAEASLGEPIEETEEAREEEMQTIKRLDDSEVPVALGDEEDQTTEVTSSSAHRPTTLMITSNSNESSDEAECTTNDPAGLGRENDPSQEPKQEGSMADIEESKQEELAKSEPSAVDERVSGNETGAVPRLERSVRSSPRTTTLVKVKVEKRPVGSHSQVRERNSHDHLTIVRAPSVEEEVRGLMQEVKEATSQIKQEVKELRQADTPTPDTPTPLREFKEFLNREEEQEQERLPTIKEMCRESEEDSAAGMGGEHTGGNEYLCLRPNTPVHEPSLPEHFVQPGFDDKPNPDSGYSTMEGYYAKSVDPSQTAKYSPSRYEMVPEGSFDEQSVKSELKSPSNLVDIKRLPPLASSVGSALTTGSEKQSKSKLKSFLKKVYKLTSKGSAKYETRISDEGEHESSGNSNEQNLTGKTCTLEDGNASGLVREKREEIQGQAHSVDNVTDSVKYELSKYLEQEKLKADESDMLSAPDDPALCHVESNEERYENFGSVESDASVTSAARNVLGEADPPTHYVSTTSVTEFHFVESQMPCSNESQVISPTSDKSEEDLCTQVNEDTQDIFSSIPEGGTDDKNFTRYYENLEYLSLADNFQIYESDVQLPGSEAEVLQQALERESLLHTEHEPLTLTALAKQSDWKLPVSTPEQQGIPLLAADYVDNIGQSVQQRIGFAASTEETAPGRSIDMTFQKIDEEYEETTSFNQHTVPISESPLSRQGSKTPKLSAIPKFSIPEEEYDDYIELPDTDVVEIMETVIEVDETEESDEMHQKEEKDSLKSYGECVNTQERCNVEVGNETDTHMLQTWKTKKRKKEHQPSKSVHEDEIQLLSEADIQTMNEPLQLSEDKSTAPPLEAEDKTASTNIICLPQDPDKTAGMKLRHFDSTGEALVLEADYQEETDETSKPAECKSDADRAREITEHILKQIDNMDVGNRKLSDLGTEGDIDFMLESSRNKIPASRETDSEMEMSFSDDFPVRVPEINETDSWLKTIKAYQSLTAKASGTRQDATNTENLHEAKQESQNVTLSDCDWLQYMKTTKSSSHNDSKDYKEDPPQVKSDETLDQSLEGIKGSSVENVSREDTPEMVQDSESSDADPLSFTEQASQQHTHCSESTDQSPYKLCLYEYVSDGRGLQLRHILEDKKVPSISHDIASTGMVDKQIESPKSSSYKDSSDDQSKDHYILNDNEVETQSHHKRNDAVDMSVEKGLEYLQEAVIPKKTLLTATEKCSEIETAAVKVSDSELYSDEQRDVLQSTVNVNFSAISDTQESEPVLDSRMEAVFVSEETKKKSALTHVSEELKAIIYDLEHSLIAGEGMHLEIGPLIEKLDEMEREMVDLNIEQEPPESSIPALVDDLFIHDVVSTSQTSPSTEEVKMPVGLGKEAATLSLPGGPSPTGDMNGDIQDAVTDVEELHSEGDISPTPVRKTLLVAPKQDAGALTDTEDMDLSGEEEDLIPEKKNLPTLQAMGLLPEPVKEVVNLTEGYAREPSPLLGSDSEGEKEDIQGKHKKNMKKIDSQQEIGLPADDIAEGLTDVEDMQASGEEEIPSEVEDSLPDYYMAHGEDVTNKEDFKPLLPTPKILVTKKDDSSDDEISGEKKSKSRHLRIEGNQEGTTDVEDLDVSDKEGNKKPATKPEVAVKEKVRRKKQIRKKAPSQKPVGKDLTAPTEDSSGLTDIEVLTGDEEKEEDTFDLQVPEEDLDELTDSEDVEASDTENVEDLVAKPIEKVEQSEIPAPHRERVTICDVEEKAKEESGAETDEEGFELNEKEDERPLMPRKKVTHEPLDNDEQNTLEVEEAEEAVPTDTEDFDIEEKEEKEVMDDMLSRIPEEGEIYTLTELEANLGKITKKEMMRDVDAEIKQKIKDAEQSGITIQQALEEESLTDVEDLDAPPEARKARTKKIQKKDGETSEESVTESDIEEEIVRQPKSKKRTKRLPIAPQLSEVRFVETESGPLTIVITPDSKVDAETVEDVKGVIFIESEDEAVTDVEDISDGEGNKPLETTTAGKPEPLTDTEDLDFDPAELDRPLSPLPPHLKYNVLESPKRELVYIKEDKYGVPQVTVRKLKKDELFVSDLEESGATDTEDIDVSEEEALRLYGATTTATSDFELSDSGNIEVSSKTLSKALQVEPDEEEGSTDVEELLLSKKSRRKPKGRSKLTLAAQGDDSHTDTEFLSDQDDKGKLAPRTASPNSHTDVEDFEQSDIDVEDPDRYDAPTPDIIRDAAVRKTITLKEGPDGTTYTEDASIVSSKLLGAEVEPEGTTDIEEFEASGAEDEPQTEHPAVDLPEYEASNVDISERSSVPSARNEEKQVKDNLLLPEDNFNNITDVESLGEGEGNRCASNTSLLSGQQLTCAVESCSVDELPYPSPATDPKLCIHPGLSLESDPFCSELTNPLVVEAELEQVYYHTPQDRPEQTEMELEAHDGCVIRRRQVVASMYQAREIRRFWSQDRNTPLQQSEMGDFASPDIKKGFKTILYLEQPNLLDTISISDTLCDPDYFRNERLLDFDSSSDSFDDQLTFKDSDAITVIDQLDLDRDSSFDDLPSPHLSNISSSVIGSIYSERSFCSDQQLKSFCSTPLLDNTVTGDSEESLQDRSKNASFGLFGNDVSVQTSSPDIVSLNKKSVLNNSVEKLHRTHLAYPLPLLNLSNEMQDEAPKVCQLREWGDESSAGLLADSAHYKKSFDPESARPHMFPLESMCHNMSAENTLAFVDRSQDRHSDASGYGAPSFLGPDISAEAADEKIYISRNLKTLRGSSMDSLMPIWPTEMCGSNSEHFRSTEQLRWRERHVASESQENYAHESLLSPSSYGSHESVHKFSSGTQSKNLSLNVIDESLTLKKKEALPSSIQVYKELPESSNILAHTGESAGPSFDHMDKHETENFGTESFIADCHLGFKDTETFVTDIHPYHDDFSPTVDSSHALTSTMPTCTHHVRQNTPGKPLSQNKRPHKPAFMASQLWRHTLPRMCRQLKNSAILASFKKDTRVESFVGVKNLIDQWEEIVEEEKRRSLPVSPAIGRKVMPPFDDKKYPSGVARESGTRKLDTHENSEKKEGETSCSKGMEGFQGSSVVEEVASVGDIILQFEGKFGQGDKLNISRQRVNRAPQSPSSRSSSHPRQVATVKPLREFQQQEENQSSVHEVNSLRYSQESMEGSQAAEFVPRVMESLSITKSSEQAKEEDPPMAGVLNPEGELFSSVICQRDH